MGKSVLIMGGGMAGLCAGALLCKRGYQVTLLEKQEKTGGYVSGFVRDDFYFDATGSFLAACLPGSEFFDIFEELEVAGELEFIQIPAIRNIYPTYDLNLEYQNPSAYVDALIQQFPQYAEELKEYAKLTTKLGAEFLAFERAPMWKKLLLPFLYRTLFKSARHSHGAIFNHFFGNNDELSHGLSALPTTLPPSQLSYIFVAVLWAKVLNDGVFYPKGGMVQLTNILAQSIRDNGGTIITDCGIEQIKTRSNRVTEVVDIKGHSHRADWYIGALTPYHGQAMLEPKQKLYGKLFDLDQYTVSPSAVLFYLGIKESALPEDWPYFVSLHTGKNGEQEAQAIAEGNLDQGLHLVITTPSLLDQSLAPEGFHSLKILVHTPHASKFEALSAKEKMKELQAQIFQVIADKTDLNLKDTVVLSISASPQTLIDYTDNIEGAMYGLDAAMNQVGPRRPPTKTKLKNLLWIGHYTRPAHGIVGSGLSGSFAANIIHEG